MTVAHWRSPSVFTALFTASLLAQSSDPAAKFVIADVHSRPPESIAAMRVGFSHGVYELRNATMVDLIRTAWSVDADRVVGGPDWMEGPRFDVVAGAPAGTSPDALHAMLRTLLAERFHLTAHKDTRDLPAFAISAGRKVLMKPAAGSEDSGCRYVPGAKPPAPRLTPGEPVAFACRNVTMAAFADAIPTMRGAYGYIFNYPVADRTGLSGTWNFDLKWAARVPGSTVSPPPDAVSIFDAFEKQLGLKLDLTRVPAPVVVVDSVNETPTPNGPEVRQLPPAPPLQFEVAEIKPADPDMALRGSSVAIQRGGRVLVGMTLKGLIQEAWGDLPSGMVVGGPKSIDTSHFVVIAKAPAQELVQGPGVFNGIDIDSMRAMLRALVIDRFRLIAHNEERVVAGYALLAVKPKLRRADPSNHAGCRDGPGPDGKDPRLANPVASNLVTCLNVTLAEFASQLRERASSYLYQFPPVVDATGIEGRYDISINFSPPGALRAAGDTDLADPTGAISLFEAVDRQLGLKLESRKVTATLLVIDSVDEMPSAN